jgi:hypothetical protein
MSARPDIAVIGSGPAGLMAAEAAANAGARVAIYERMPSPARKFLLAGRGGLNLTHSEALPAFLARYGQAQERLAPLIEAFGPEALQSWAEGLGEACFTGSSGRVFPKSFKASPLLRAWLRRLGGLGVELRLRHAFRGWDGEGRLRFETPEGERLVEAKACVLALGGASWPRLGSDGGWVELLRGEGLSVAPLRPSNCGFEIDWSPVLKTFAGAPFGPVTLTGAGRSQRGECVISEYGIEGGAIYALSAPLRDAIDRDGSTELVIDMRPDVPLEALAERLGRPRGGQSMASVLRKSGGLTPVAAALAREPGPLPADPAALAARIKALPLRLMGVRPIARAISSAGGLRFDDVTDDLMVRARPGLFVAGEMLDWEAPTGGYLLQACFASGRRAGEAAAKWAEAAPH